MIKKIIILILGILLLTSLVNAQEIATQEDVIEGGITPESPLYGLDIAIEKITEVFSENAKLNHVKERLSEIKVMIHKNKIQEAERVRKEFESLRIRIKNQTQVEEHKKLFDNLGSRISQVASQKGNLTETQRTEIKNLILQHKERIRNEGEEIENKVRNRVIQQNCEKLFNQGNLSKIECIGNWKLENNQCKWECES